MLVSLLVNYRAGSNPGAERNNPEQVQLNFGTGGEMADTLTVPRIENNGAIVSGGQPEISM